MGLRCSDPLEIGCDREVAPGFVVGNTAHRKKPTPCQSCRWKVARRQRAAAGRPEPRNGPGTRDRL